MDAAAAGRGRSVLGVVESGRAEGAFPGSPEGGEEDLPLAARAGEDV